MLAIDNAVLRVLVMSQDVRMKKRTRIRISGRRYLSGGVVGPCVGVTATGEFRDRRLGHRLQAGDLLDLPASERPT